MNLKTTKYGLFLGTTLSGIIVLDNVVFPSYGPDWAPGMLLVAAIIGTYIVLCARRASRRNNVIALKVGAITSLIGFLISMLTFVIIDNIFLSTVSKQADKINGFQHSSYHSMQAFINAGLIRGILFGVPASIIFGLFCGWMGSYKHNVK